MSRPSSVSSPSTVSRKLPTLSRERERIRWIEEHKSWLLKGAGLLFVLVVGVLVLVAYLRHQNLLALEKLRVGVVELQAGRVAEAISLLEKAKDLLGSGDRAQVADFYLLEAYARQKQLDRVQSEDVSQSFSVENDYLPQIVLLARGRIAEKQNDYARARKLYEDAAALAEGPLTADALLGLARVAQLTGDAAAAKAAHEKFLTAYPSSPFADIIRQKLGQ